MRGQYLVITSDIQNSLLFPLPRLHSRKIEFHLHLLSLHDAVPLSPHKIQPLNFMPVYPIYTRKAVSNAFH